MSFSNFINRKIKAVWYHGLGNVDNHHHCLGFTTDEIHPCDMDEIVEDLIIRANISNSNIKIIEDDEIKLAIIDKDHLYYYMNVDDEKFCMILKYNLKIVKPHLNTFANKSVKQIIAHDIKTKKIFYVKPDFEKNLKSIINVEQKLIKTYCDTQIIIAININIIVSIDIKDNQIIIFDY